MEWRDEGLIIGVRRHGEQSAIVEAMTRAVKVEAFMPCSAALTQ